MSSGADLFVVCKQCGSEVSPYITECPYCGHRLRRRAPKLPREHVLNRTPRGVLRRPRWLTLRSRRWHSLRATAYSHGRSRSGSRSPDSLGTAMTNVSCTASAASAGSRSIARQKLYNGAAYLSYASASPAGSPATMAATTSLSRMPLP